MDPLHSCIAALHKMCLRIAQLLAIKPAADARDGLLPFHRISCSPLEVLTFTPKGPRFSDGPIFWRSQRHPLPSSLCGTRYDRRFSQRAWLLFLPGGIDTLRQESDLRQPSAGERSRQQFKAASVAFNNERQRHQIEEKVVDRMCERIGPLFELNQQGARLFDRGPAIVCVYQCVNPVKDLQASSLSPSHTQRSNAAGE
ncbi:MAG: hypothetical protein EOQ37_34460 [Mesorhizobium sp.]|nr:MAG: hypothetical protein EOQ37_34460 [Mesorhizobium sp.]